MKKFSLIATAALMLVACSDNTVPQPQVQAPSQPTLMQTQQAPQQAPQQVVQAAPAPQQVVVQQAPAQDHTMTNMLLGGLIGHAIGSAGNRPAAPAPSYSSGTTVVHKTVINKTIVQQAPAAPPKQVTPPAPAPVHVAPAPSSYKPATTSYSSSGASSYRRK